MSDTPVIYLVDDDDQSATAAQLGNLGVEAEYLYPTEVNEEHLSNGTLLAIDEFFNLRHPGNDDWALPPDLPPALIPEDGLALAAIFRSAGETVERSTPLGITMRTSQLDALAHGAPRAVRKPFVAAQYDLEWATSKEHTEGVDPLGELVSLAWALHSYPSEWAAAGPRFTGLSWLGVPDLPWADLARNHVLACRPPANTTTSNRHNLAWFRWLAQSALPFPTFVVSDVYAATSLGVTVESFRDAQQTPSSELGAELERIEYSGPLSGLQPIRFWRAGLRNLAASVVDDELDIADPHEVGERLSAKYDELDPLRMADPVVAIDDQYMPVDTPAERGEAVRLAPDGWPVYADAAWAAASMADDPAISALRAPQLR